MLRYPLNSEEIMQKKRALKKQLSAKEGLLQKRVALLSGTTIGEIKPILELFLLDAGIEPVFFEGAYGRYYEELMFDEPSLRAFAPEILYIHTGIRNIAGGLPVAGESAKAAEKRLSEEWDRLKDMLDAAGRYACPVIANNFELPSVRVTGSREAYDPAGKVRFIHRLNERLADYAEKTDSVYLNDLNYLSAWYGLSRWSDPSYYNAYKYGLHPDAIPLLSLSVASIIKAVFGKNKKVLMTDLDNTLWGGVVGDDGAEGLRLGAESPEGMAYSDLQRYMKELRGIGVLLGVASKNDERAALEGFTHPSSALSPDDFSVFYANWEPKDQNLAAAAAALNLGSDSFVFLDDNPAERELVEKSGLGAEVAAFDLPERAAENLSMSGYFETVSLSGDDLRRAEMYRENRARETERRGFVDYGDYLRSLGMKVYFSSFPKEKQQRITQLANKTNQFNLTTRRYTPEEIGEAEEDAKTIKIAARLTDKFGDNGIVAELIARQQGTLCNIETFLMSCRVFKRDLELAVFDELIRQAKTRGITVIGGVYIATPKNGIVRELYPSLGFEPLPGESEAKGYRFQIPEEYQNKNKTIEVLYE